MSERSFAVIGLIALVLGSVAAVRTARAQTANGGYADVMAALNGAAAIAAARQAPIGHRQPRPRDIPAAEQLSPLEQQLRQEDERIDKKLIICRRC